MYSILKKFVTIISILCLLFLLNACAFSENEFKNIDKYEESFNINRNKYENDIELIRDETETYSLLNHLKDDEYISYYDLICHDKISLAGKVYEVIFDENVIQFSIDSEIDDFNGYYYSIDGNAYDPIGYSIQDIKEDAFYQYSDRILTKGKDFSEPKTKKNWDIEIVNEEESDIKSFGDRSWYYLYRIDEHWFYYQIIVE